MSQLVVMWVRACWSGSTPSVVAVVDGEAEAMQAVAKDRGEFGPVPDWVVHRDAVGITLSDPDDNIMDYRIEAPEQT